MANSAHSGVRRAGPNVTGAFAVALVLALAPSAVGAGATTKNWCPARRGSQVVFSSSPNSFAAQGKSAGFEIWKVESDGSGLQQLTKVGGHNAYPTLSSDGQLVAWASDAKGNSRVVAEDCEHSKVVSLLHDAQGSITAPAFSPDGTKLAFVDGRDDEYDVYVISVDGSENSRSVATGGISSTSHPAWSPDGTKIAFAAARDTEKPDLYVVNADGTGEQRLTSDPASDAEPAWSPDGTRIAFYSDRDDGGTVGDQIWMMQADGTGVERLTDEDFGAYQPAWSPDGTRLAYVRNSPKHSEIYTMNADGSGAHALTKPRGAKADEGPAW